ncbi:SecDF P1 head subdomain-containing protein [Bacillaceae bacterium W0354]
MRLRFVFVIGILIITILVGCQNNDAGLKEKEQDNQDIVMKNKQGDILLTTSDFTNASYDEQPNGGITITIHLVEEGKLEEITKAHISEQLDFYLYDELIVSPRVTFPITGDSLMIDGNVSEQLAKELVLVINNQ